MVKQKDFNALMVDAIELISKFVVPLYSIRRGNPVLIGSGFFVEVNKRVVLVSAAHVLNQFSSRNPLYTYEKPDKLIQIGGERHLSNPDGFDLGFIVTSNVLLPWPDVEIFPCGLDYLCADRIPRAEKHYVITGYPETKNRVNPSDRTMRAEIRAYHARSIPDEEYAAYNLNPSNHVALPLDRKKAYGVDGSHQNFPKPQGMSGAPIWELFDESFNPNQPRVFPIVAVGTTYKNKIIFGTDVGELYNEILNVV